MSLGTNLVRDRERVQLGNDGIHGGDIGMEIGEGVGWFDRPTLGEERELRRFLGIWKGVRGVPQSG